MGHGGENDKTSYEMRASLPQWLFLSLGTKNSLHEDFSRILPKNSLENKTCKVGIPITSSPLNSYFENFIHTPSSVGIKAR